MSTWYLGPLGDLRALTCPEPGVSMTETRYGGIHQGLSGARIMDVTGHRAQYEFAYTYMDWAEWSWLDALHLRHVPGPFRLINPMKKNRLSPQATRLYLSSIANSGVSNTAPYSMQRDWPSQVPIPGRSVSLSGWAGSSTAVLFDRNKVTPVFASEQITVSIYLRGLAAHTGTLAIDWYNADLVAVTPSSSTPVSIGTSWNRFSHTATAPAGAAGAVMRLTLGTANTTVRLAAPQLEKGNAATTWETGGGAPMVHLDQLETTSPRFPLRDCSLTLLEA